MKSLMAIMLFIQAHTGLTPLAAGDAPVLEKASMCDMAHIVEGPSASCNFEDGKAHVRAAFLPGLNRLLLPDDFDSKDPVDVSFLIHEVTHAMQRIDPKSFVADCLNKEAQAYNVQGQFLFELGIDPRDALGFTSALEGAQASCHVDLKEKAK